MRAWQVLLAVYVLAGLLAAIGGLLFSGTTGSVGVDQTNSYLLPSVAATVIGGTSILGGAGGYSGTILGALILTVLNRLLLRLDVSEAFKQMLYGVIVLALAWLYVRLTGQKSARASDDGASIPRRDGRDGGRGIGTGFMGVAHTEALRRLGHDVVGIVGSTPARRGQGGVVAGAPAAGRRQREALLADPASPPSTSPAPTTSTPTTSAPPSPRASTSCARSRSASSAETAELIADGAETAGIVHAVCFNIRYYAQNQNAAAPGRRRRHRRAAVRHGPLPPGLAAARHRLEPAPRRRSSGSVCAPSPTSACTGWI